MDLNKAMVIGRLTRDPETRTTPSGQQVCNFAVATNLSWTDQSGGKQEKVEYHNVVAWRKLAEICSQYLNKGKKVYIEGRLQTQDWEGKDGVKRYKTEIVAENMIMLDGPGGAPQGQAGNNFQNQQQSTPQAAPQNNQPSEPSTEEVSIEDIPF